MVDCNKPRAQVHCTHHFIHRNRCSPAQGSRVYGFPAVGGPQNHHPMLSPAVEAIPELHELVLDAHSGLMVCVLADAQQAVHFVCGRGFEWV